MTMSRLATVSGPAPAPSGQPAYRPGVCNIGPQEIARRRRAGHVGSVATLALFAALVAVDAPPLARLSLVLPAGSAASGYLQAWLRFCAGFGSRGVFNFGPLGRTEVVASADDRARDRARSRQIGLGALAVGAAVAIVATLLPI